MDQTTTKTTNWLALVLIAVVILALAFLGFLFLTGGKKPPVVEKPAVTKIASEAQVEITKDGFSPETIQVQKGTQVTWTNKDSSPHQVASDPHPTHTNLKGLVSDSLTQGDSFSFIFEKEGTFTYHDHLNPLKFKGTVIVR